MRPTGDNMSQNNQYLGQYMMTAMNIPDTGRMLLLGGIGLLALTGLSDARFENPGIIISQLIQSISASLAGGYNDDRSDSKRGGCVFGGANYAEGAWVPVDTIRRCQCTGGRISEYCMFPSFPVQTKMNFQVEQKGLGRVQVTERQKQSPSFKPGTNRLGRIQIIETHKQLPSFQSKQNGFGVQVIMKQKQLPVFQVNQKILEIRATERQKQFPSFKVETEGPGVRVVLRQKQNNFKIKEEPQIVKTKPRLTSGRGTAKLFKLFTEEHKPVIRTSNKTGCYVRGHFYNFPLDSVSAKATCKCTDVGMLWCWEGGVPSCTGCFVSSAFFEVGDNFRLTDGTDCTCHCGRQASSEVCMAGTLDHSNKHV